MDDRLHKFIRLVDSGSFTNAARELHVSQPALSIAIKALERQLGVELILRTGRRFQLTAAGKLTYQTAKALEVDVENLRSRIGELSGRKQAIALGMIDSIAEVLFTSSDGFEQLAEQAQVSLVIDNSLRLTEAVSHSSLDLAIVTGSARLLPHGLDMHPVGVEPLLMVAHRNHAQRIRSTLEKGMPLDNFICYNQASYTHALIETAAVEQNIEIRPAFYSTSPEMMLRLVLMERGVAVLPYATVSASIQSRTITPLPFGHPRIIDRPINTISRSGKTLPSSIHLAIRALQKALTDTHQSAIELFSKDRY